MHDDDGDGDDLLQTVDIRVPPEEQGEGRDLRVCFELRGGSPPLLTTFFLPKDGAETAAAGAQVPPAKRARKGPANSAKWQQERLQQNVPDFDASGCGPMLPAVPATEMDVLKYYWDPIRTEAAEMTNRYAYDLLSKGQAPKYIIGKWRHLTPNDMDGFLACIMYMGLVQMPCEKDYWRMDAFGSPFVRSIMSRDNFKMIKRCFSVALPTPQENDDDLLAKTRWIQDLVNSVSIELYMPQRKISLDESQAQCGGRNARISHRAEKNKPLSDYVRAFTMAEVESGFVVHSIIDRSSSQVVMSSFRPVQSSPATVWNLWKKAPSDLSITR